MLTSRTIAPCFSFSWVGAVLLCLLVGLGLSHSVSTHLGAGMASLAVVAEDEPGTDGFTTLFGVAGESAVLQVSEPIPFLKASRLSFRGLHLATLPVKHFSRSHTFCLAATFFRILPNAP